MLSSVLSAVGFLEAMVNELFQDAHDDHAPDGGAITPLDANTRLLVAEYWRSTEQGKGRALDKYQALLRFAGEPVLSQGAQPFQDASLAVQLRNAIARYRPQDLSADTPSLMEQRLIGGSRRRRNGRARELRCPSSNGLLGNVPGAPGGDS